MSKILLIDNEARMVDSLKTLLTMEGYEVVGNTDPTEALELLNTADYDIVISDIKMPNIGGLDILKTVREKNPYTEVILITGYASLDSAKNAIEQGAFGYLTKPLELDELKLVVARGIEKRNSELERLRLLDELRSTNEKLQIGIAQVNALSSAGNLLSTTTDLKEALTSILSLAIDVIGAKIGSVILIDNENNELYIGAACGLDEDVINTSRMKLGSSISGYVAETGMPLIVEDIEKDERFARINRQKYESKSLISVPLKYKDQVFGVINLNNKLDGTSFTQGDLNLLNSLAPPAAVAIDRANLIAEKSDTIDNLTTLHNYSKVVSMLDAPEKMGEATYMCLKDLFDIKAVFWYDYFERKNELRLEFYYGGLPFESAPDDLRLFTFEQPEEPANGNIDFISIQKLIKSRFKKHFESKIKIAPLSIVIKRSLSGFAVLIFNEESIFSQNNQELATLVLSQTAAIYQRQKAISNATQLVTMGKLIAEIGHDLKKPLTNLKGALQIYSEKIKSRDFADFFPESQKEVSRMSELVKEMVEFSDPNKYQTNRFKIGDLLDKSVNLLKTDLKKKNIKVIKNYDNELPRVMVNDHEMLQVFINILLNAVDSMDKGGKITIGAFEHIEENDKWLRLKIEDNGYGIPEDKLNKIFDRYYTTKKTGTGLGLAIVERIISVHNGRIFVSSAEGRGTVFTLDLRI
jgi:signal transduction histidine kinase/CheY-like chemotaxis protein